MSAWWTGLSPAQASVECDGRTHTLRWHRGKLTAVDHGDLEAEATLAALAGRPVACVDLMRAWNRRRDDPRVLTVGSRGVGDALDIHRDRHRRPGPPADRVRDELLDLLELGGGVPERLQAHAAGTWARRLTTGHRGLDAARPQLHAALYGRVLLTLRGWLGEPELAIALEVIEPDGARSVRRDGDTVNVALPFSWVSEVWARGLTTVLGRLCLSAETPDGERWQLQTLGPDLRSRTTLTISARSTSP